MLAKNVAEVASLFSQLWCRISFIVIGVADTYQHFPERSFIINCTYLFRSFLPFECQQLFAFLCVSSFLRSDLMNKYKILVRLLWSLICCFILWPSVSRICFSSSNLDSSCLLETQTHTHTNKHTEKHLLGRIVIANQSHFSRRNGK